MFSAVPAAADCDEPAGAGEIMAAGGISLIITAPDL